MVRNYKRKTLGPFWTKEDLFKAVDDVKNKRISSYHAAKKYNIPRSTIVGYVAGKYKKAFKSNKDHCVSDARCPNITTNNTDEAAGIRKEEVEEDANEASAINEERIETEIKVEPFDRTSAADDEKEGVDPLCQFEVAEDSGEPVANDSFEPESVPEGNELRRLKIAEREWLVKAAKQQYLKAENEAKWATKIAEHLYEKARFEKEAAEELLRCNRAKRELAELTLAKLKNA